MKYSLDENQEKIVSHIDGPALVLAGPGSGKTTVLIERTIRLARKIKMPQKILCVTFTNAAAREMEKRFLQSQNETDDNFSQTPVFKTVHSFCNEVIKEYERSVGVKYKRIEGNSGEKRKIFKDLYKEINGEDGEEYIIDKLNDFNKKSNTVLEIKGFRKIMASYDIYKNKYCMIDFDDMITIALGILSSAEKNKLRIREYFCSRFDYIQVDEAQDLTSEQFAIIEMIGKHGNVFVVADDDQSIYGFRGAAPECLFKFQKNFSDCQTYYLSRNYRSVGNIVDYSCKFIAQNKDRFSKNLYSKNIKGPVPRIKCFKNGIKQAEFVCKETKKLLKVNKDTKIGVLYRNNISGLLPRAVFVCEGYNLKCGEDFFKTREMDFLDDIISVMRSMERNCVVVPTPSKMLRTLREEGLSNKLENYCRNSGRNIYYKEILSEFLEFLCMYSGSVKNMVSLLDKIDDKNIISRTCNTCCVELSTVHSSKGLEYDVVFLIDVVRGEFPGRNATVGKALEEERRLFYVAMTRAKESLYVLYPQRRGEESAFITELKKLAAL